MTLSQYIALFVTSALYGGYISVSFNPTLSKTNVLPLCAATFAIIYHLTWVMIARGPNQQSAYMYALASDILLTTILLIVPVMGGGIPITSQGYFGISLIIVGYMVVKTS